MPLWWRGIGVNVAFAGRRRRVTAAEVDAIELLTPGVAPAVVNAGAVGPPAGLHRPRPSGTRPAASPASLTRREIDVLALLVGGLSDREIAARLGVSPKPVEKHVGAVLRKTGTAGRTAAVVYALERGWLPSTPDAPASAHR